MPRAGIVLVCGKTRLELPRGQHLDAVLLQIAEQILRLIVGQLGLFDRGRDALIGEEPPFVAFRDDSL